MHVRVLVSVCIYVYILVFVSLCIHIYICNYYISIQTYIYIYVGRERVRVRDIHVTLVNRSMVSFVVLSLIVSILPMSIPTSLVLLVNCPDQ